MNTLIPLLTASIAMFLTHAATAGEIAVDPILDEAYGKLDAGKGCRHLDNGDNMPCMKMDRIDRLETDTGPRVYVLMIGDDPNGGHAATGVVGAWIIDAPQGQPRVLASAPQLEMGSFGSAPAGWTLIKLSKGDYWGWHNTFGDIHQGYSGSVHSILAPFGSQVRELAGFIGGYSDSGACADKACEKKSSEMESTLAVDDSDPAKKVYPLKVTITGRADGHPLAPKTWSVPFDVKTWKYVPPKNWPLVDRDF